MVKQQAELQKYLLWKEYLLLQERKYGSRLLLRVSLKTKNIYDKEPVIKACKVTRDVLTDTEEIDREMSELLREIEVVTELTQKYVYDNSSSAENQETYLETYNSYVDRYEQAQSRYDELKQQRETKISKRKATDRFISELSKREELLTDN